MVNGRVERSTVSPPRECTGQSSRALDLGPLPKTLGAERLAFFRGATRPLAVRLSLLDCSSILAAITCPLVRNKLIAHRVTHLMFHRAPVRAELK